MINSSTQYLKKYWILNYKFPQNGNYSVKVVQAMRRNVLPGIEDIGIKIQNLKP